MVWILLHYFNHEIGFMNLKIVQKLSPFQKFLMIWWSTTVFCIPSAPAVHLLSSITNDLRSTLNSPALQVIICGEQPSSAGVGPRVAWRGRWSHPEQLPREQGTHPDPSPSSMPASATGGLGSQDLGSCCRAWTCSCGGRTLPALGVFQSTLCLGTLLW